MKEKTSFVIPETFEVFGRTVNVIICEEINEKESCYGYCDYTISTIYINKKVIIDNQIREVCKDLMYQTYLHEKVHMMLDAINEHKLSQNEKFVDNLAGIMHQVEKTSKGSLKY